MITSIPGVCAMSYLMLALENALDALVDEGHAQQHMKGNIFNNSKPSTNMKVADSHNHW